MVHPRDGFLAEEDFPTIASLNKWFDKQTPVHLQPRSLPEHRLLPHVEEEKVSPEERERRYQMLKGVARELEKVAKANVVGRPLNWEKTQAKDHSALLQTEIMQSETKSDAA